MNGNEEGISDRLGRNFKEIKLRLELNLVVKVKAMPRATHIYWSIRYIMLLDLSEHKHCKWFICEAFAFWLAASTTLGRLQRRCRSKQSNQVLQVT